MSYAHTQLGGSSFNHGPSSSSEAEYDRLRDLAHKEQSQHQHFAAQAREAYERGDGAGAHNASEQSKQHAAAADKYNKQASEYIFQENNAVGKVGSDTIDLHGQYVEEAEEIVEQRIRYAKQSGQTHLHVIVGKGNHSQDHIQKIKPKVEQICQELGLQEHTEQNEGRIYIDLTGGDAGQAPPQQYNYQQHQQPQHQNYGQAHYQTAYPMGGNASYSYAQAAGGTYPGQQQQQQMQYGGQNGYAGQPQQQIQMQQPQQQDEGIKCCGIKICVVM
ncbi:hypothetical protein LTR36_001491 [Oleoguttula mirabilis]|uniref:Smr domain-containing protein n=1 Tax=Oleoguttula mirabilis TaxID=1507867 RepID=A0AAV9JN00_9PEZI|nr:hypothetical protein LTR36_001491 [Oleoguttula mirabilis]